MVAWWRRCQVAKFASVLQPATQTITQVFRGSAPPNLSSNHWLLKQTRNNTNASKHVRYFKERRVRAHPTTPSFAFVVGSPFVFHTQSTNNSSDLSIQLSCVVVQYSCISTKTNNLFFLFIASVHPLLHHTPAQPHRHPRLRFQTTLPYPAFKKTNSTMIY